MRETNAKGFPWITLAAVCLALGAVLALAGVFSFGFEARMIVALAACGIVFGLISAPEFDPSEFSRPRCSVRPRTVFFWEHFSVD
jgi:hypothetical protein